LKIVEPYTSEEFKKYFNSRWEILRKPWGHEKGSEVDDNENISLHVMAIEGDDVVGIGRLTYFRNGEGQIRYMGVKDDFRKKNVGKMLLEYLENEARDMGLERIFLNSRDSAYLFYSKMGYKAEGKPFDGFSDIAHTKMVKVL